MYRILLFIFMAATILSCRKNKPQHILPDGDESKISSSFYRQNDNMLNHLFNQMADTSERLKQLAEKYKQLNKDCNEAMEMYNGYVNYFDTYYRDAVALMNRKWEDSNDSLQAADQLQWLSNSHAKRIAKLSAASEQMYKNRRLYEDAWLRFKIAVTSGYLDNFLQNQLPKPDKLETTSKNLKTAIDEVHHYTP